MIPMNAFIREPEELIQAQIEAVTRVIRSGWWILGKEVQTFEREWANRTGCSNAVGVGNGMDALEIGLRSLGIGPGDEVITTAMTAFATALAILRAGATPVVADIEPETAILSVDSVARCIGPKTKAVIVVHLYGRSAPLDEFQRLCSSQNLHLIEDCAQAHGARFAGKPVGCFGAFAGWSFYPTKNLGTIGDGGALTTSDSDLAEKARQLRNYGQSIRYHHPLKGLNSRLDEIHAGILLARLPSLDSWIEKRRQIAEAYHQGIKNPHVRLLPLPKDPASHVHHLFAITSPARDRLAAHLQENGIETLIHYPIPIQEQKPMMNLPHDPAGLPAAKKHAAECLSLPCNPFLTDTEIATAISSLNQFKG